MQTPLLVITSNQSLGESLRGILEDTGRFLVGTTGEVEAAGMYAREVKPALAFLDATMAEADLLKIGALLRQSNPSILLVVLAEAGWHNALEELFPRDYISKPVKAPDLLKVVDKYFPLPASQEATPAGKAGNEEVLPWLKDVSRAAQHLTRLTLESAAQAALINRVDKLWAYAGQLPQPAARELAETLARYWDHQEENDVVRFVRLKTTNAEHMLYATKLAEGMVLALVFDAETPFSTIRTQASQLVHTLSDNPTEEPPTGESDPGPDRGRSFSELISGDDPGSWPNSRPGGGSPRSTRQAPLPAVEFFPGDTQPNRLAPVQPGFSLADKSRTGPAPDEDFEIQAPPFSEGRKIILEPISPAIYNLDYACVLVPRFPQHYITGDLLDRLGEWVPQICIAFAWRLEYISVRPEYLQWVVNVPPVTAPAHLMRILRQQTSAKIFAEFPRFKKENPSGEFWAPGYLIMGGSQPPPAQLIKDFIIQTRQKQGIFQINQ